MSHSFERPISSGNGEQVVPAGREPAIGPPEHPAVVPAPASHPETSVAAHDTRDNRAAGSGLLTQSEMLAATNLPIWVPAVYREFRRNVLDPDYPCYFAVAGEQKGTLRYAVVDNPATGVPVAAVHELIALSRQFPQRRHALAVFVRPESELRGHDFYRRCGWDQLQKLHDQDTEAWPTDVPRSPTDPKWEFCFGGEPMFVFGAMPSHFRRRSRNLGPSLILLFQPRSVFRGIEGGTLAGTRAREVIRRRLAAWDLIRLHGSMGDYGDPSNFEAAQYFIPDDESPSSPCPLAIRGASTNLAALADNVCADRPRTVIEQGAARELDDAVRALLPAQGSVEVQRDAPGRWHPLHTHPVNEILHIVTGSMEFHVHGERHHALPGATIKLPAGTPHSSVAGPGGCVYLIAMGS